MHETVSSSLHPWQSLQHRFSHLSLVLETTSGMNKEPFFNAFINCENKLEEIIIIQKTNHTTWHKITHEVIDLQPCKHSASGSPLQVSQSAFSRGSRSLRSSFSLWCTNGGLSWPKTALVWKEKEKERKICISLYKKGREERKKSFLHRHTSFCFVQLALEDEN